MRDPHALARSARCAAARELMRRQPPAADSAWGCVDRMGCGVLQQTPKPCVTSDVSVIVLVTQENRTAVDPETQRVQVPKHRR